MAASVAVPARSGLPYPSPAKKVWHGWTHMLVDESDLDAVIVVALRADDASRRLFPNALDTAAEEDEHVVHDSRRLLR